MHIIHLIPTHRSVYVKFMHITSPKRSYLSTRNIGIRINAAETGYQFCALLKTISYSTVQYYYGPSNGLRMRFRSNFVTCVYISVVRELLCPNSS